MTTSLSSFQRQLAPSRCEIEACREISACEVFSCLTLYQYFIRIFSPNYNSKGGGELLPWQPKPRQSSSRGFFCIVCVCVCVCVYGHSVCEFTLLSSGRRRGHPPLTLCQRGRERASESRERAWLKPHNAPHAAGLKSCGFISSCSRGCLWAHTHSYTQTEARKYTDVQAGKTALLWPHR